MDGGDDGDLGSLLARLDPGSRAMVRQVVQRLIQAPGVPAAVDPLSGSSLPDLIPSWANHLKYEGKSPETIKIYGLYVSELLAEIAAPTPIQIDTYLGSKASAGSGPRSIGSRISAYRSFYGYLEEVGLISGDPTKHLKTPRMPYRQRNVPSAGALRKVLNSSHANARDRAQVMLMAGCGLRVSELVGIRIRDLVLDLRHGNVTVIGKGNKQRTVPMVQQAAEAVVFYLVEREADSKWLFPGHKEQHLHIRTVNDRLQQLSVAESVPTIRPHDLRHYFASALLNAGVSLLIVSRLLGHSSPAITARSYWHLTEEGALRSAIEEHNPLIELMDGDP